MKHIVGSSRIARYATCTLVGTVAMLAMLWATLGNPFATSSTSPVTIGHAPLNKGGLPVGDQWVDTTVHGNLSYEQTMSGTIPDQPVGLPELVISSVATTSDICNVGTAVASYSGVKGLAFDQIAGCHDMNNALAAHDNVGCYNSAVSMYRDLTSAINNATYNGTLTVADAKFLQHQLDFNLSGFTVADACGLRMDSSDPRGVRPVSMIK